ncbi:hypothetical protein QQF64_013380 [Cirrhinus molitorella]|uniref:Uncharacterized protein n=1 Tax=Cirrhinus molitorella TaxID=172907 RepID=A0ABR3LQZ9_9TELE
MDSVGVNVIETAALGRPFQLGMLYDCRKDALIPGITLWDKEQLQQSIRTHPQINTNFKVTASDSIEDKSSVLNIDSCLEMSLLGGLLYVGGAAKYLNDTKKSFKQQRLTLHYHSTSKFEELTMNHLASGNIAHHEVFENDTATHVVTAVLYGADACFVFDREVSADENESTVAGELQVAYDKLKGISVGANIDLSMNDNQKTAVQKFTCTFYGDFQLPSNPTSFEDALKVYAELPKLLGENKELVVPLRVWLYPLDKLHSRAAKLQKNISIDLIKNFELVIESLNTVEMKCSDLLKDTPALTFALFNDKIQNMKRNCHNYKLSLMKKLGILLPKIRGDMEKDTALIDLLHEHEDSPFRETDLEHWLNEKEKESSVIKTLLRQLNDCGANVEVSLDKILMDLEVENLVCYTFTSFKRSDVLLSKQKDYLIPSSRGKKHESISESKQNAWLTPEIKNIMRSNLKLFKSLINSKDCKPAMFIIASKEMENNPGSCILLYENGCDEAICFAPPSKPACPIIEQFRDSSVVLKVPPPCHATMELKLLYKMKEEKSWKSQPVMQSQDTVTLTDLSSDTEFNEVKCAAIGKLNYSVDSDVIHLRVIDKNLIRASESIIEYLSLTENKCSKLLRDPRTNMFSAFYKKFDDMRQYCQTYKEDFKGKIKSLIVSVQACEKETCALTDLLQAHEESPFKEHVLAEWITITQKEMNTTNEILQQLLDSGAEMDKCFDVILSDVKVDNLLCYTFSSIEHPDGLLSEQEKYLKPHMIRKLEKTPYLVSQTWLTGGIREKMRTHLKMFKELMTLHSNHSTKFFVSSKDHQNHPGSCILLYENGCDEAICFAPPTKPACPIIKQVRDGSVVLKVPPPCHATMKLKLLYKMKEEKSWKSQPVMQSQITVTLTDLNPDTKYEIKCAAVGKLNYTVDSDVIRVITERTTKKVEPEDLGKFLLTHHLSSSINVLQKYLKRQDLVELNIGVTGESGSGKSTFVNAFRGLGDEEEGSATTGPVETTIEPEVYLHPKYKKLKVWDLPGIGTPNFKADEYLELVQFERYDFFIIIASDRFRECQAQLAKQIRRMRKTFYFVRSKVDSIIDSQRRKKNFDLKKTLDTIREDCEYGLRRIGIEDPVVFLISSWEPQKYDFNLLQEQIEKDFP